MKFVSKSGNYSLVLSPGIPADPISGRLATPTLSVRFEDGMVEVRDEELIVKMLAHSGYGTDFFSLEEDQKDPFTRKSKEPDHDVKELMFGHVGKSLNPKGPVNLSPEVKDYLSKIALEMAKPMAEEIGKRVAQEEFQRLVSESKSEAKTAGKKPQTRGSSKKKAEDAVELPQDEELIESEQESTE